VTVYQATGVAIGGRGLLIEGPPGSGKSSLALALIDRGARLIGDDAVTLELREGRLWALPPPNVAGLIEVRNAGLVACDAVAAPVALVVQFDRDAPRFVEQAGQVERLGVGVPLITLWPDSPVLALRAEHALALHGLA
jgi:serine kinase of HPr protein (carbohydrate metabolism regulator)